MKLVYILPLLITACATQAEPFEGFYEAAMINKHVNAKFDYHYDIKHEGRARILNKGETGKCGDFALTKCKLLVDAGFSPSRLSFVWYDRDPTYSNPAKTHAVCVVDGKYALDWHNGNYPFPINNDSLHVKEGAEIKQWKPQGWPYK